MDLTLQPRPTWILTVLVTSALSVAVWRAWPLGDRWLLGSLLLLSVLVIIGLIQGRRLLGVLRRVYRSLEESGSTGHTIALNEEECAPLSPLAHRLNVFGQLLAERQRSFEQAQQLLYTLIDSAPMAMLLLEDAGEIEYTNEAARLLFFEGRDVEGQNFLALLGDAPPTLREAVLDINDRLFTVETEGSSETYHLSKRQFELHGRNHTLLILKHLTRELRRQEIDIWKKLIRVVSHELNNSLAPISSLVHSARLITAPEAGSKLERVYSTIQERAQHLQSFVEGYARVARLPAPRQEHVDVSEFLRHIEALVRHVRVVSGSMATGYFDRQQLEQVVINLLKNAEEAGGPKDSISLEVDVDRNGVTTIRVQDAGLGMSPQVLQNAMLPFYSTKERGSGLGLALCREIIEAHGGSIRLENRPTGGVQVTCMLPGSARVEPPAASKLTLSRL